MASVDSVYLNYELGALRTLCKWMRLRQGHKSARALVEATYVVHLASQMRLSAKQVFLLRCASELEPWLSEHFSLEEAHELLDIAKIDRDVIEQVEPNVQLILYAIPSGREVLALIKGQTLVEIKALRSAAKQLAASGDADGFPEPLASAIASAKALVQPLKTNSANDA